MLVKAQQSVRTMWSPHFLDSRLLLLLECIRVYIEMPVHRRHELALPLAALGLDSHRVVVLTNTEIDLLIVSLACLFGLCADVGRNLCPVA